MLTINIDPTIIHLGPLVLERVEDCLREYVVNLEAAAFAEHVVAQGLTQTPEVASAVGPCQQVEHRIEASAQAAAPGKRGKLRATLTLLPGVGPSRAQQIIDYRRQHPFKRPEELTRIRGIGRKTFVKLRPYLALSGPTTLAERPALARRAPTK